MLDVPEGREVEHIAFLEGNFERSDQSTALINVDVRCINRSQIRSIFKARIPPSNRDFHFVSALPLNSPPRARVVVRPVTMILTFTDPSP